MGTGAFIYATRYSKYGMTASGLLGPGTFVFFFTIKVLKELTYRCKTGRWIKPDGKSILYDEKNQKIKWLTFFALFMNLLTNVGYFFTMTYAWEFAKLGGMNQGVISSLVSFASVFNIIAFYLIYKEKITLTQFMGVLLLLGCAVCLALEAGSKKAEA